MRFLPAAFFAFTLILGIFLFDDYGISWDEPIQRDLGNANWNFILHGDDSLFRLINKYHGPFAEIIEVAPEKILQLHDERIIFLSRHLLNYLIFWIGSVFLFLLGKEVLQERWLALLAVAMLYLTPRIFAHAFYNSKDIPLLSFFIISNYFLLKFLKKPSISLTIVLALVSAMLFNIRILGIIIPVFATFFFILNLVNKNLRTSTLKFLFAYLILFVLFAFSLYPVTWHDPIGSLKEAFRVMSHYPYDDPQFFLGELIKPQQLPWYYIPVWIGITIPIVWQLFSLTGLMLLLITILLSLKSIFKKSWPWLLIVSWCIVPWLMVVLIHSIVYDEWRHLFFIYPAVLLIACFGIRKLFKAFQHVKHTSLKAILRSSSIAMVVIQGLVVLQFMIINHPFENVYFNHLAGKYPQQRFDLDYWGLSYRQALEFLTANAKENSIKVCWQNAPGSYNLIWLDGEQRNRIREMPFSSSEYFLTNFRFNPEQYTDSAWNTIRVNGITILAIEKPY
jgi:hypothetical protein